MSHPTGTRVLARLQVSTAVPLDDLVAALVSLRTPLLGSATPVRRAGYGGRVRVRVQLGSPFDSPPTFVGRVRDDGTGAGELVGRIRRSRVDTGMVGIMAFAAVLLGLLFVASFFVSGAFYPGLLIGFPGALAFTFIAARSRRVGKRILEQQREAITGATRAFLADASHAARHL